MSELYIGLLSGTSVDGIDAALVDFAGNPPVLLARHNPAWPDDVREAILQSRRLSDEQLHNLHNLHSLDRQTGECFADAVLACLQQAGIEPARVRAIGSHGQTIRHRPDAKQPFSLQIGNAAVIAERTGIDVIHDFRRADIAVGGQGAPLVPAFHQAVFRNENKNRVLVNIGGIANITVLPKDRAQPVIGFDTGPGNTLMDAWARLHLPQSYDIDGAFAASGQTHARLLTTLLADDYFLLAPPKSTGFEQFNLQWLTPQLPAGIAPRDVQSTLCDLTATSIIRAIDQYAPDTEEIYVCGGGVHNRELMRRLQTISRIPTGSTQALDIDPDWVEAMCFAWLAKCYLENRPGNLPSVTGASRAVILGKHHVPGHLSGTKPGAAG